MARAPIAAGGELAGMSVQQILTFCGVYEHGGYADAAAALGLAPPTMWEQVKALQRIYGVPLFERSGRSIVPTQAGRRLYEMLAPLLVHLESTVELVAEQMGRGPAEVRLITGMRMAMEELGEPLGRFRKRFPEVRLRLIGADNVTAQRLIAEGAADMALMIRPSPEMLNPAVICRRLYQIEYLAALPPRHRLGRSTTPLSLRDLAGEPLIVGTANTTARRVIDQAWFRLAISTPPQVVAETDNSAVTIACARAGLGVGIIAGRSDGQLTRHVKTRSLAGDLGRVDVVAALRKGRQLTEVLATMLDMLQDPES